MTVSTYDHTLSMAMQLTVAEQLRLFEELTKIVRRQLSSTAELEGVRADRATFKNILDNVPSRPPLAGDELIDWRDNMKTAPALLVPPEELMKPLDDVWEAYP